MASVNKVILIGNLGRDPETRYTTGGDAVTNLNIATSEQWKDKSGEKITCKAGDDVLVVATAQVKDKLLKHGDNPTHCPRVILSYAGERKLGRGSMNVYSAHFEDEKLWASRSEFAPDTIFVDPFEVKQMGNGIETRQLPAATAS